MQLNIQHADAGLVVKAVELLAAVQGDYHYGRLPPDKERCGAVLSHLATDPRGLVLVAVVDDRVVGVFAAAAVDCWWSDCEMVTDLVFVTDREHRGAAGLLLLRRALAWADGWDSVGVVMLGVTSGGDDEIVAGQLYERLGFDRVGGIFMRYRA